jgi:hypothetical protein
MEGIGTQADEPPYREGGGSIGSRRYACDRRRGRTMQSSSSSLLRPYRVDRITPPRSEKTRTTRSDARSNPFTPRGTALQLVREKVSVESRNGQVCFCGGHVTNDDAVEDDIDDEGMMSSPDAHTLKNCEVERESGRGSRGAGPSRTTRVSCCRWPSLAAGVDRLRRRIRACWGAHMMPFGRHGRSSANGRGVVLPSRPPHVSRRGGAVSPAVRERRWASEKKPVRHTVGVDRLEPSPGNGRPPCNCGYT